MMRTALLFLVMYQKFLVQMRVDRVLLQMTPHRMGILFHLLRSNYSVG